MHVFHLLQTASPNSIDRDVGIPARGWHGEAYRGHVFWDELFIFPFLTLRFPMLCRALLLYRYRRLPEARRSAREAQSTWKNSFTVCGEVSTMTSAARTSLARVASASTGSTVTSAPSALTPSPSPSAATAASRTRCASASTPSWRSARSSGRCTEVGVTVSAELPSEPTVGKTFSYPVPAVPRSTFALSAITATMDFQSLSMVSKRGLTAGATNVTLDIKPFPSLQTPADKANEVTRTTELSWIPSLQGSVSIVTLSKGSKPLPDTETQRVAEETPFSITIVTSESRTTIPDLSALGMALPASTSFTWRVQTVGPVASMDSQLTGLSPSAPPADQNEMYFGSSAANEFKTAAAP